MAGNIAGFLRVATFLGNPFGRLYRLRWRDKLPHFRPCFAALQRTRRRWCLRGYGLALVQVRFLTLLTIGLKCGLGNDFSR